MTTNQKFLADKHGTPREFEAACWRAVDGLMITPDEARAAIASYEAEWARNGADSVYC